MNVHLAKKRARGFVLDDDGDVLHGVAQATRDGLKRVGHKALELLARHFLFEGRFGLDLTGAEAVVRRGRVPSVPRERAGRAERRSTPGTRSVGAKKKLQSFWTAQRSHSG